MREPHAPAHHTLLVTLMAPLKSSVAGALPQWLAPRALCGSCRPGWGGIEATRSAHLHPDSILEHESSPFCARGNVGWGVEVQLQEVPRCRARPRGGQLGLLRARASPQRRPLPPAGQFYFPSSPSTPLPRPTASSHWTHPVPFAPLSCPLCLAALHQLCPAPITPSPLIAPLRGDLL